MLTYLDKEINILANIGNYQTIRHLWLHVRTLPEHLKPCEVLNSELRFDSKYLVLHPAIL